MLRTKIDLDKHQFNPKDKDKETRSLTVPTYPTKYESIKDRTQQRTPRMSPIHLTTPNLKNLSSPPD